MAFSRNIDGVEVKYTRGELSITDLSTIPDITEDGWATALEMDVSTVIPRDRSQLVRATAVFPSNGIYKVFIRMHNNLGNLGPISFAGVFVVSELNPTVGRIAASPAWTGTAQNMVVWTRGDIPQLFPDAPDFRTVTFDEWNGGGTWPFGAYSGTALTADDKDRTRYTTREVDFGRTRRVEVIPSYIAAIPPTLTNQAEETFVLSLRHSTTSLASDATEVEVTSGMKVEINARYMQARVRVTSSVRSVLADAVLNWRTLD